MVLEECPLNRYTPQQDDYRPTKSDDEIAGNQEADTDSSDEDLEKEQHCDLLIAVVSGNSNKEDVASAIVSSIRNTSPRLTRSRAARSSSDPPKHKLKSSFQ